MRGCSHLSSYDVEIEWQTGVEADLGMLSMYMPKSVFSKKFRKHADSWWMKKGDKSCSTAHMSLFIPLYTPSPTFQLGGLGSAVSSPSRVWGGVPAEIGSSAF